MPLNIIKGPIKTAVRAVIYGPAGVGKSTLASQFPAPLIIDVEESTARLDVDRVAAPDWRAIEAAVKEFTADPGHYKTLVFDTADWAEKALIDSMLRKTGKRSIEDYGYGKGYTMLAEEFSRFLGTLDAVIAKGVNVVLVAHSITKRMSPPDQTDGYDRYELKLSKQVSPLVMEWAEDIFFCNFQIQLVEGNDGKIKAQGGRDRVIYAMPTAAWEAKNRHGLPECMPMEITSIEAIFTDKPVARPTQATKAEEPADQEPAATQLPAEEAPVVCSQEQAAKLELYAQNSTGKPMVDAYLAEHEVIEISELSPEQADELIKSIQVAMNTEATKAKATVKNASFDKLPSNIRNWLTGNRDKLEEYLIRAKWLKPGETLETLPLDKIDRIVAKPDVVAKAAGIPTMGRAA